MIQAELELKIGRTAEWVDNLEMGDFDGDALAGLQLAARALNVKIETEVSRIQNSRSETAGLASSVK